ncbi:SH3 domain-containing protein [Immundisolibacter sp.]|uniref:SH3 domain-containing protein n=1 Tax=Immundisolibacter sp. TaxID=1934948 RepID=UPI00260FD84C|nr:SH3 domain-containing protein [Immundisolibacter sp.]MDD3651084.1 SH3 domain-containing protein [Immundisolibacter sp.]
MTKNKLASTLAGLAALSVAGCASTQTQLGGGGTMVTGSAGAAGAQGSAPQLTRCASPIGTAALVEQDNPMLAQVGLSSPIPLLRIMMAQSNCFQVVDRGQASQALQRERAMASAGELQSGSNMGAGQMKAADFLITPNVVFKDANAGGGGAGLGSLIPGIGGAIAGGIRWTNMESQVTLFLTNVRTGVQEAAAEGSASKRDIGFGGLGFGGIVGAAGGSYASTDIGKIVAAALLDAHNKLVAQVQATQPAATRPSASNYVTLSDVNMRSGPSTQSPIVMLVPKGTPVAPNGEKQGAWWGVDVNGRSGWVHSDFITR